MFALRLKELREERGLSQQSFANKLKISQSTVGMWESGKREPGFDMVIVIAEFFQCSVDYLLGCNKSDYKYARETCKQLYEKSNFTVQYIENYLSVNYQTFRSWYSGTGDYFSSIEGITKLADMFNVPIDTMLGRESKIITSIESPYNPIVHKIPILGYISAGLPIYAEEHIEDYTYTERNGGAEYFALKVKGDSMSAAKINDGDLLIVRRQDMVENGEIAVVIVNEDDATVKRFRKEGDLVQLIPQSYNPDHPLQVYDIKNTHVRVLGKVVECKTEF